MSAPRPVRGRRTVFALTTGRRAGARLGWLALLALALALLAPAHLFADAPLAITVYGYDASTTREGTGVAAKLNDLFSKLLPGLRFEAFARLVDLRAAMAKKPPDFVLIPPYFARSVAERKPVSPLFIRERDRSSFTELLIVGQGPVEVLRGKTVAASGDWAEPLFLERFVLRGTGLKAVEVHVLEVGKDIDGVLAAGSGQAAVACASRGSVDLVKRANPGMAKSLGVVSAIPGIPLSALFAVGAPDERKVAALTRLVSSLGASNEGRRVLRLLKADRIVAVDAGLKEKLGP